MSKQRLKSELLLKLEAFREQGKVVSVLNPILAVADEVCERLYKKEISHEAISDLLTQLGAEIWKQQTKQLRVKTGNNHDLQSILNGIDLASLDISKRIYNAVFTAHPVFALVTDRAADLSAAASTDKIISVPENPYQLRQSISLNDEHCEAVAAILNARAAIRTLHKEILTAKRIAKKSDWNIVLPVMCAVSTWVGYDLDGRSDITWIDSFLLRLKEKKISLDLYASELAHHSNYNEGIDKLILELKTECQQTAADIERFSDLDETSFSHAADLLSERTNKLASSLDFADRLHKIALDIGDSDIAIQLIVLAGDIACHGFGLGEIHLRINAVQLRNAMGVADSGSGSLPFHDVRSRVLMDDLCTRIKSEPSWKINFQSLSEENATARRQMMLATQILKHVDCDQPIRLLIAECEKPVTIMTALYLAYKFGIADRLDISPLFETTFGLEHGVDLIDQLLRHEVFCSYVRQRGRLAIETGFSDAGRFIGQVSANLAIERLQLKIAGLIKAKLNADVDLLIFNTHGESLGRGCAGPKIVDRQNFILTPYVRAHCKSIGVAIHHESSFQGGDGYRMFGNEDLALSTIYNLFAAEIKSPTEAWIEDGFYKKHDYSLGMFLSLKAWHEKLFHDPNYGIFLDIFGVNFLPKTGSRAAKRQVPLGINRQDPSKMRAIPHNAILQQLGFLVNVISGFGGAAQIDREQFLKLYQSSPRLKQLLKHVLTAKELGSLNTVLAYAKLLDNGFWIDRAYHGYQPKNLLAYRRVGKMLSNDVRTAAVQHVVWWLRDDLIDLYDLSKSVGITDVRISGNERVTLDLIHAIRIALIIDSLALISRVPKFAASNLHSNDDVLRHALSLDFDEVQKIIRQEFSLDKISLTYGQLSEKQNYKDDNSSDYQSIVKQILDPLDFNHKMIKRISQMVSGHYGAHG